MFKSGLDADMIWLWRLLKCSVAHLPCDWVYTVPKSVNGRPQPPSLLKEIHLIQWLLYQTFKSIKLNVRTAEIHLLPEAISNPITHSGREKPAFLLALNKSLVIFLSPSHHESDLAASSIFSFIKFSLTSVANKPCGGSAGITSSCLQSLWIACILMHRFYQVFIRVHTWWAHSLKSILSKEVTPVAVGYLKCLQGNSELFHLTWQLLYVTQERKNLFSSICFQWNMEVKEQYSFTSSVSNPEFCLMSLTQAKKVKQV